jgi:mono/diheme cytochrome c family protein
LAGFVGLMTAASGDTASTPGLAEGAFTEAQAIHGQEIYYTYCVLCHGDDMSGRDQAPPLAGPQFADIWEGESLWSLVNRLDTMPPDRPGILSREETVDLLTYLLWFNGLPLGEVALATDRNTLESMTFETPLPDSQLAP